MSQTTAKWPKSGPSTGDGRFLQEAQRATPRGMGGGTCRPRTSPALKADFFPIFYQRPKCGRLPPCGRATPYRAHARPSPLAVSARPGCGRCRKPDATRPLPGMRCLRRWWDRSARRAGVQGLGGAGCRTVAAAMQCVGTVRFVRSHRACRCKRPAAIETHDPAARSCRHLEPLRPGRAATGKM